MRNIIRFSRLLVLLLVSVAGFAHANPIDTLPLPQERFGDFMNDPNTNTFDLRDPSIIEQVVEFDIETGYYVIYEKMGDEYFRTPTYMTFTEYMDWRAKRSQNNYFRELAGIGTNEKSNADRVDPMSQINPDINNPDSRVKKMLEKSLNGKLDPISNVDIGSKLVDRLFGASEDGETKISIKPQGNLDLTFGGDYFQTANPNIPPRARRTGGFFFQPEFQLNVTGSIGEKLKLNTNYNTQGAFQFDQIFKLDFNSAEFSEDDILKSIEMGNVSMPLRSQLIQGAQSLFGAKAKLQFGNLSLTLLASNQNSQREEIQIQGGSQIQEFRLAADQYEENRHFFISHYNRDNFESTLTNLPQVMTLFSAQNIEVWVTNMSNEFTNTRVILALSDLGEYTRLNGPNTEITPFITHPDYYLTQELPTNQSNNVYEDLKLNPNVRYADQVVSILQSGPYSMQQGRDFEVVNARKLEPTEYDFNPDLGTITLKTNLRPDQVLAVSYNYTYRGENVAANGDRLKIGEFRTEFPEDSTKVLVTKLLKSTTPRVDIPMWDLMMKNIYNVGAYQADSLTFKFDVMYQDPGKGDKRFLPEPGFQETPLIQLFNLDNLNIMRDPQPDGRFDYLPGITIKPASGRVMFPKLEPFGSALRDTLGDQLAAKYVYQQLYDSTLFRAQEFQELNRFVLVGSYRSSVSSEISLGTFNLPRGSVQVSAGGRILQEGVDYDIDYSTGRIKILNDAILQQGAPIRVSFEDNQLFGTNQRTMLGLRADYALGKNSNLGATYLHLWERPFTQKVNVGEDPINNRIYGLDYNFSKDAPLITRLVDALPGIQTKETSNITFQAEVAAIDPGHSRAINTAGSNEGNVYVDDFEGSVSPITLATAANSWSLASIPQDDAAHNNPLFRESSTQYNNTRIPTLNRALLNWRLDIYDQLKTDADRANPYTRNISKTDIFPNQTIAPGDLLILRPFDIRYWPNEPGPYNFDIPGGVEGFSQGLNSNGTLLDPATRWAGIMRELTLTDFEATNIEFMEFWLLDPFITETDNPGKLYINLGQISEDVLPDGRQLYENALPTPGEQIEVNNTNLGRTAQNPPITFAFDNGDETIRKTQDVGIDGLNDVEEQAAFADYLVKINNSALTQDIKDKILSDPSRDNFVAPADVDEALGFNTRMQRFNGFEGNTPIRSTNTFDYYPTQFPDQEDLNDDRTLNQQEAYYQYEIPLEFDPSTGKMKVNKYVTDAQVVSYGTWFRFKVPIDQYTAAVGGIQGFRSIRFMRMYVHGFEKPVTLRFATMELVRSQWRRYKRNLNTPSPVVIGEDDDTGFDINAVNIEENSNKIPFHYTLPLGINREPAINSPFANLVQNEQSLSMTICGLRPNNARAAFKILNMDMRVYKNLKMYVHAESKEVNDIATGATSMFVRIGSDFENNYYEYEYPLVMSDVDNLTTTNSNNEEYIKEVWRSENELDIPLAKLIDMKQARNDAEYSVQQVYEIDDPNKPGAKFRVKGNPNLGVVKGVMIGVRNRDNYSHCVEVWLNELRLTGLDEQGGVAGLVRTDIKLADFGVVTASGNYSTIGFGALDKRLAQRQRESILEYGATGQFELGQFLPEKLGVSIPFFAQYSEQVKTPQFDPYDFDIKLKDKVDGIEDLNARDSVKSAAQTVQTIKSYNFTNVRIQRTNEEAKPRPWDVQNFGFHYAYTETDRHDPIIELNNDVVRKAGMDYAYNRPAKYLTPFKGIAKNDKYIKFITELNFNPIPNLLGFNSMMERQFVTTKYRFAGDQERFNTFFTKRFAWDRTYDMQWDITKSLKLNFDVTNNALVDEPYEFGADGQRINNQFRQDSIWNNVQDFGRTKNYAQNLTVDYTLPFKYIPYFDFAKVTARFGATYGWSAASLNVAKLGNVVQNTQLRQINGDFDLNTLYNKSAYLKKINQGKTAKGSGPKAPAQNSGGGGGRPGSSGGDDEEAGMVPDPSDGGGGRPGGGRKPAGGDKPQAGKMPRERSPADELEADIPTTPNPATPPDPSTPPPPSDPTNPASLGGAPGSGGPGGSAGPGKPGQNNRPGAGKPGAGKPGDPTAGAGKPGGKPGAPGSINPSDPGAAAGGRPGVGGEKKKKEREPSQAERMLIRPLLSLRTVKFRYTENFGSVVPGFMPQSSLLGQSVDMSAPGASYALGSTPDRAWLDNAANSNWISRDPFFNDQVQTRYSLDLNANATIEPFKDFRIELEGNRKFTRNHTEYFLFYPIEGGFRTKTPQDMGMYSISYLPFNTAFVEGRENLSALFQDFMSNREVISRRLGVDPHPINEGYTDGYGKTNQAVIAPAFLATYAGLDANTMSLDLFQQMPKPNWRLTYNGLAKLAPFKKKFQSINISHSYKSTMAVSQYQTSPNYLATDPLSTNANSDYYSRFEIPALVITEQFAPLIGVDVKLKNNLGVRAEYKKMRTLSVGFSDYQLNEQKSKDFVFGFSYRMTNVDIKFLTRLVDQANASIEQQTKRVKSKDPNADPKAKKKKGNDLNLKLDVTYRDDITFIHQFDRTDTEPSRGATSVMLTPSAEYILSKQLTLRAFLDYNWQRPYTSQSFQTTNARGGITVRFNL
jgi:cell surface protein SprA